MEQLKSTGSCDSGGDAAVQCEHALIPPKPKIRALFPPYLRNDGHLLPKPRQVQGPHVPPVNQHAPPLT